MECLFRDLEILGIQERTADGTRGTPPGGSHGVGSVALAFWVKSAPYVSSRPFIEREQELSLMMLLNGMDREKEWVRAGDFTGGALGVARVMFLVVGGARMREIEGLEEFLGAPWARHVRKRWSPCQYWRMEDLSRVRISRDIFIPPSLALTPFPTLSTTFDSAPGSPALPFDLLVLLTALMQRALVPPSALTPQLYTYLSQAATGRGRAGQRARAECKGDLSYILNRYRYPVFDLVAHLKRQAARRQERAGNVPASRSQKTPAGRGRKGGGSEEEGGGWRRRVTAPLREALPEGYCRIPASRSLPWAPRPRSPPWSSQWGPAPLWEAEPGGLLPEGLFWRRT